MSGVKRALAGVAAAVTLGGAAIIGTAAPAQADAADCEAYMSQQGYVVGPIVREACAVAEAGNTQQCFNLLIGTEEVAPMHASWACGLGDDDD